MEQAYAQALWKSVAGGREPKDAVAALHETLQTNNRLELMPRILRAFKRLAEEHARKTRTRLWVARQEDAKHAFKQAGVTEADVCVDESLIGGWRLESNETLVDASYKNYLLDMFNRATR